jgi:hypothetical protein
MTDYQLKQRKFTTQLKISLLFNIVLTLALLGTYVALVGDGWPFTMNLAMKRVNMPCKSRRVLYCPRSSSNTDCQHHYWTNTSSNLITTESMAQFGMRTTPSTERPQVLKWTKHGTVLLASTSFLSHVQTF